MDAGQIEPDAVIAEFHGNIIDFLAQMDSDHANGILARIRADLRRFNAVGDTVAQQMLKRRHHPVQHATVHFKIAALQIHSYLFAGFLGGLPDHPVQTL